MKTLFVRLKNDTSKRFEEMEIIDWGYNNRWLGEKDTVLITIFPIEKEYAFWRNRILKSL